MQEKIKELKEKIAYYDDLYYNHFFLHLASRNRTTYASEYALCKGGGNIK